MDWRYVGASVTLDVGWMEWEGHWDARASLHYTFWPKWITLFQSGLFCLLRDRIKQTCETFRDLIDREMFRDTDDETKA